MTALTAPNNSLATASQSDVPHSDPGATPAQDLNATSAPGSQGDIAYRLVLSPHRSMTGPAFYVLMGAFAIVSVVVGGFFLALGAWPVTGYFGLDMLAIYAAFRWNYRAARQREHIVVDRHALTLTRTLPSGEERTWEFNPYWARVAVRSLGRDRFQLEVTSHGKSLVFGQFLPDYEKHGVAQQLQSVLGQVRTAGPEPLVLGPATVATTVPNVGPHTFQASV